MLITRTVTKKILEDLVHETFSTFGTISSSSLLDSLKLLGFFYATNAGISINIEDLKTPDAKKQFLETAQKEVQFVSEQWNQGFVSDIERFQSIIDSWNVATESLKNRVIDYYRNFDPANNLYIMAFSGARGNMSQVRQLIGMRGLMSDQEGNIIDLPIKANFREGLSSIDYIISSYGARKGIVDTALKTADSGYLTRRLIYIAQDLIIREIDCKTSNGVIVFLNQKTTTKNLIGRFLISSELIPSRESLISQQILTNSNLRFLKNKKNVTLNVRSPLTCSSNGSICQKCYGWDLAQNQLISLGEAIGIIAAQSIGEPGTQLTMRTFHTGGIFTSETLKQITAPFSGKLILPTELKTVPYRTSHGILVSKIQQETHIAILDWKGTKSEIFLQIGSFLYINKSCFVKKGQLICEYSTQSFIPGARKLKPIYTSNTGEIRFQNLITRKIPRQKSSPKIGINENDIDQVSDIKINEDDGILWLASGKIFPIPKEAKYLFPKKLVKNNSFASLKLITPFSGIVTYDSEKLYILNNQEKICINFSNLVKNFENCKTKLNLIIKNYQYVETNTVLGFIDIFPTVEGKIYKVKRKESLYFTTIFLITESDIWTLNLDHSIATLKSEGLNKLKKIRTGMLVNNNASLAQSGFFVKKDGFKSIFQRANPTFLRRGTLLNFKNGDLALRNQVFATLVNYTQQTEDIVQGLPKIEELIEARKPKIKAYLAKKPGILLNSRNFDPVPVSQTLEKGIIKCTYNSENSLINLNSNIIDEKQEIYIINSFSVKNKLILFNNNLFFARPLLHRFKPIKPLKKQSIKFSHTDFKKVSLVIRNKIGNSIWTKHNETNLDYDMKVYNSEKNELFPFDNLFPVNTLETKVIYKNKLNDFIIKGKNNRYYYFANIDPIARYKFPVVSKVIIKSGSFVDIGEPITEGIIDVHELLNLFFKYHLILDGTLNGTLRSLNKFQLVLVNSIQSIYQSQGVNISSKHIEIIVRQMTAKVVIKDGGDTPLLNGELIRLSLITEIYKALKLSKEKYKTPKYEPLLLSTTNSSLGKEGFLSAAGFQETKRVLTKAAIENTSDWLRGLKECVIIGRLIPAGSAFLNYKNYLDNIYLFKE